MSGAWIGLIDSLRLGGNVTEAVRLGETYADWLQSGLERSILSGTTPRESERMAKRLDRPMVVLLRLCLEQRGNPGLESRVFRLGETLRAASSTAAQITRHLTSNRDDPELEKLRAHLMRARQELTAWTQQDPSNSDGSELASLMRRREEAERALRLSILDEIDPTSLPDARPERVAAALSEDEIGVATWRLTGYSAFQSGGVYEPRQPRLLAWVLRPPTTLQLVDLGLSRPIEELALQWRARDVLGARGVKRRTTPKTPDDVAALGESLRRSLLDPLGIDSARTKRLNWVPSGSVANVPLESLPVGSGYFGDAVRVLTQSSLAEVARTQPSSSGPIRFLAVGGIDYGGGSKSDLGAASRESRSPTSMTFAPLPASATEVERAIALFESAFESEEAPRLLVGAAASRDAFAREAADATFIHLATHGYFQDSEASRLPNPPSSSAVLDVRALVPRSLCGLAFAGANLAKSRSQRSGVLTAEEIMGLDLTGCDLIVLSACETGLGLEEGGQGLASLQAAVHAAGARTAITSVWPVPDEVTRELMSEFYRQLWIEKRSKADALWIAKQKIRKARENDKPRYGVQDWAGWILSGESGR